MVTIRSFRYHNHDLEWLDCIQDQALDIFGKYDLDKSLIWMTEEYGEVIKAIRKGYAMDEVVGEMGDLFAWMLCVSNILGIRLSEGASLTFEKEIGRQLSQYGRTKYSDSIQHLELCHE